MISFCSLMFFIIVIIITVFATKRETIFRVSWCGRQWDDKIRLVARSILECSLECANREQCKQIMYNNPSRTCMLNKKATSELDGDYFIKMKTDKESVSRLSRRKLSTIVFFMCPSCMHGLCP